MPVDHSKHGFLKDIGTDWVALAANGEPLARAHDEESIVRAAPHAAHYITGKPEKVKPVAVEPVKEAKPIAAVEPETAEPVSAAESTVEPEPDPAEQPVNPAVDHDGDGKMGGSEKGENATASKSRRKRKPAD